jgi:hypothetical protein
VSFRLITAESSAGSVTPLSITMPGSIGRSMPTARMRMPTLRASTAPYGKSVWGG